MIKTIFRLDTIEKTMDFGKRVKRNRLSRWIWKYVKLSNHAYLIAMLYEDYIMIIGDTFICTNCAIVFPDIDENGNDSQTLALTHISECHTKVVDLYAQD